MRSLPYLALLALVPLLLTSCKGGPGAKSKLKAQRDEEVQAAVLKLLTRYLASNEGAPFGDPDMIQVTVRVGDAPAGAAEVPFACEVRVSSAARQPTAAKAVPSGQWRDHLEALRGADGAAHFAGGKVTRVTFGGATQHLQFSYDLDVARGVFGATYQYPGGLVVVKDIKP